jgi:hypothetical protein
MASDLLKDADKIYGQFSGITYSDFLGKRYGVKICSNVKDKTIALIRKEMLDWQRIVGAVATANIGFAEGSYILQSNSVLEVPVSGDGSVINVNMGGCIINLKVTSKSDNYVYVQSEANTIWTITHNLGYNPLVRTEDGSGNDIEGIINYLGLNALTIEFSTPVSGTAYLS